MIHGYIEEEIIDRIRQSIDIVEILSDYIPLKKTGQNYKGLCPFHSEKTPSFMVSPSKQLYHCFGCGAGGDVFNFLVRYENFSFPEAIKLLAKKAGIKIDPKPRTQNLRLKTEREYLLKINKEAADYFHRILLGPSGKAAREYLLKRNIKDKTIKDFKLGFSPPAWEGVLTAMREKSYSTDFLQKAGLIIPRESGKGYYDRFRNRIIFPISNIEGDIVGFGGRVMDETLPKYLNSPETLVYSKGENLYAIDKATDYIRKNGFLILVEGYMDAIALHQSGVTNTAATLGTALTKGHLRAVKRFTKKIVVVFDADEAGKKAASMGLDLFLEEGIEGSVAALPSGEDPDSFILKEGKDKFLELISNSSNIIDFSLKQTLTQDPAMKKVPDKTQDWGRKTKQLGEALAIISKIPNSIERGYYLKQLSEQTGINQTFLIEEFMKLKGTKKKRRTQDSRLKAQDRPKAEETLIHFMLKDKMIAREVLDALSLEDFTYPPFKIISTAIQRSLERFDRIAPERFLSPDEDRDVLSLLSEISLKEIEYENVTKTVEDCLLHINRRKREKRLLDIQLRIKEAELRGEEAEIFSLLSEKQRLAKSGTLSTIHKEKQVHGKGI